MGSLPLIIEKYTDQGADWDQYVRNNPNGTLYHLTAWKNAIINTFDVEPSYFVAKNGDKICGILPLFLIRTMFSGIKALSIPYSVYGGILADDYNIEKKLLEMAIDYAREGGADHLEIRNLHTPGYNMDGLDLYVTFIKELDETAEKILLSIPRKSRASIRNGYSKYNLTVSMDAELDTLYNLYLMNKRKLGSPQFPKSFFVNLVSQFKDQAGILTIYYQEKPVSAVIYFIYNDTILPYFSGADHRFNFTNANNIMYFELMKYALQQNLKKFDFGRSRSGTGPASFKKNMGFESQPLNYNFIMFKSDHIPNISPSNKKFNLATQMWKNLPLPVIKIIGPHVVKRIP